MFLVAILTIVIVGNTSTIKAQELQNPITNLLEPEKQEPEEEIKPLKKIVKREKVKPKKIIYVIKRGDTLSKVSKSHRTSLRRVLCANPKIQDPDLIYPGRVLKIPHEKDKLRCIKLAKNYTPPQSNYRTYASSSNTYEPGQCTWHVKNLAPWVPNSWGNATDWWYYANSQGFATSTIPKKGAVAWRYGHVAYVMKVKGKQVLISEMNYDWVPYHQRQIWVSISSYNYIY